MSFLELPGWETGVVGQSSNVYYGKIGEKIPCQHLRVRRRF